MTPMMARRYFWLAWGPVLIFFMVMGVGLPLEAQNLVTNPDFDTNIEGWTTGSFSFGWDPTDSQGDPSSGSGMGTNTGPVGANTGAIQCIEPIVGGETYSLSGWVNISPSQAGEGEARVFVWWHEGADCSSTQTLDLTTPFSTSTTGWEELTATPLEAPVGTVSATVYLNVIKSTQNSADFTVAFDAIWFGAVSPIFRDGFENGDTLAWSVTLP